MGLFESPLKDREIVVYCFLISLLVLELLRFKDLENDIEKMLEGTVRSRVKSIQIHKICDFVSRQIII